MRIVVLAVGRLRPPFVDDVQHYRTLLARHARVEIVEVREDEKAAGRLPERAFVCLLDSRGRTFTSEAFSAFLEERRIEGRELWFVVGGPRGLDLDRCELRLSLGPMTLPHQLARVVLLEQLFRAHRILRREPYHH